MSVRLLTGVILSAVSKDGSKHICGHPSRRSRYEAPRGVPRAPSRSLLRMTLLFVEKRHSILPCELLRPAAVADLGGLSRSSVTI
jgi:hypothetical protein